MDPFSDRAVGERIASSGYEPTIYCDLDGVLVDLVAKVRELGYLSGGRIDWGALYAGQPDIFAICDWMSDGKQLWAHIKPHQPYILTGVPYSLDRASGDKVGWCASNLGVPANRVYTVDTKDKHRFARSGRGVSNILIDDLGKNVASWNKAGGIGILHRGASKTISELDAILGSRAEPVVSRVVVSDSSLLDELNRLKSNMVREAQKILDDWEQDAEDYSEDYGFGGPCDEIAAAIGGVVAGRISGVNIGDGGQEGSEHAFIIAYRGDEYYAVDIPPSVYETGGGYSWKKIEGVRLSPGDVEIYEVGPEAVDDEW